MTLSLPLTLFQIYGRRKCNFLKTVSKSAECCSRSGTVIIWSVLQCIQKFIISEFKYRFQVMWHKKVPEDLTWCIGLVWENFHHSVVIIFVITLHKTLGCCVPGNYFTNVFPFPDFQSIVFFYVINSATLEEEWCMCCPRCQLWTLSWAAVAGMHFGCHGLKIIDKRICHMYPIYTDFSLGLIQGK